MPTAAGDGGAWMRWRCQRLANTTIKVSRSRTEQYLVDRSFVERRTVVGATVERVIHFTPWAIQRERP